MSTTGQHSDLDDFLAEELTTPEEQEAYNRMYTMVSFGNALGYMREQRGMTQKQLADLTGIQRSVIARLESGDHAPTLATGAKLARALDARIEVHADGRVDFVPVRIRGPRQRTRKATA